MDAILLQAPPGWPAFPKYMSVDTFCKFSGISYRCFLHMVKKNDFPMRRLGTFKIVDVEEAMTMVRRETEPRQEFPEMHR
jgi:hypothetical protein